MTMISGIRWYRAFPALSTQLVVVSGNALWTAGDPSSSFPYAGLRQVAQFTSQNASTPASFAPVRDPAMNNGTGSDILVICGVTGPYGFATGNVSIPSFAAGDTFALKSTYNAQTVTTSNYTVLQTDTAETIAENLVTLLNSSSAVVPGAPWMGQSYNIGGTVYAGALISGTPGNVITLQLIHNGAGGSTVTFEGGGASTSAPVKYDGTNVSGLSYQITRPFTGCATWHNHVWFWGDASAPDTIFASDINQPEGWTFMVKNGGYDIGVGDGEPVVRAAVPIGNILYVFKTNSIFAITGYDFQSGEYQFQVQPAIVGEGTPSQQCVTVLNNAAIFWSGRRFCRLAVGSYEIEHIGSTIPITQGLVSNGNAAVIRAVSGSFYVQSNLNENFSNSTSTSAVELFDSVALFAVDLGDGSPDTVLVYDDSATKELGDYAWSVWTGWNVGCWIPFGQGPSNSGAVVSERPLLCWIYANSSGNPNVYAYGLDPMSDSGNPIPWFAQTGWMTFDTGALQKELHRITLELEATPGAQISFTITPSVLVKQSGSPSLYPSYQDSFAATGGVLGAEAHQTLEANIKPFLKATAFIFGFGENSGTSSFELVELTADYIEETFQS